MQHPDIEVIAEETVAKGFLKVHRYRMRHRKFDGGWTEEVSREVCDRGHAVAVMLYDPGRDALVMIEQFRVGVAYAGDRGWLMEIVAGSVKPGEAQDDVARRETLEEAGVAVDELITICDYYPSPGALSENVRVYCARVDSTAVGTTGGLEEEHEDIRLHVVPFAEAMRMLEENRLNNSVTIIAFGWLWRHRDELRARWLEK
jgi:ADP-ribose pyrophosphatase